MGNPSWHLSGTSTGSRKAQLYHSCMLVLIWLPLVAKVVLIVLIVVAVSKFEVSS